MFGKWDKSSDENETEEQCAKREKKRKLGLIFQSGGNIIQGIGKSNF